MARNKFIEKFAEKIAADPDQGAPVLLASGSSSLTADADGSHTRGPALPEAVQYAALGANNLVNVYQNVVDAQAETANQVNYEDHWFVQVPILRGNLDNCLKKVFDNRRTYFLREELDQRFPGWRMWSSDSFEFACVAQSCKTRLPTATALVEHVEGYHHQLYRALRRPLRALITKEALKNLTAQMGAETVAELEQLAKETQDSEEQTDKEDGNA